MNSANFGDDQGKFPKNRITFYDDFAVGQKVWLFYQFDHSGREVCEGIVEGKIVDFEGYSFEKAKVAFYEKGGIVVMQVLVRCLNHIEGEYDG